MKRCNYQCELETFIIGECKPISREVVGRLCNTIPTFLGGQQIGRRTRNLSSSVLIFARLKPKKHFEAGSRSQ